MEPNPVFDHLAFEWAADFPGAIHDRRYDTTSLFPFADGDGPDHSKCTRDWAGCIEPADLKWAVAKSESIRKSRYLDSLKQSGAVIHPNEQPNVTADIAALRRADEPLKYPHRVFDPDTHKYLGTVTYDDGRPIIATHTPGTFTEHDGTIHANLFGDDFPEYRRRNRQRYGGDAAEDRYRPDSN